MNEQALGKMNSSNVQQTKSSRQIWLARLSNIIWLGMVAVCIALCMYLFTRVKYSGADFLASNDTRSRFFAIGATI